MSNVPVLKSGYEGSLEPAVPITIANGQTDSSAIPTGGFTLCGLFLPAAFTGASISFLASSDGVTYVPVRSTTSGTLLSYTVTVSTYLSIDPKDFQGIAFLKIKSASAEGGARSLVASLKGF